MQPLSPAVASLKSDFYFLIWKTSVKMWKYNLTQIGTYSLYGSFWFDFVDKMKRSPEGNIIELNPFCFSWASRRICQEWKLVQKDYGE